jgi:phosphomannomutase
MRTIQFILTSHALPSIYGYKPTVPREAMKLKAVFFDMGGTIDTHSYDRSAGVRATAEIRLLLSRGGVTIKAGDEELYDRINTGDYLDFLQPYKRGIESLRLVSDCSNGAVAYRFGRLVADLPIKHCIINAVPDGRFPQHGPNPLGLQNLRQVREKVRSLGAATLPCPVGHALIKTMLRRERGLYAGELTGHYYFRDFFYCGSALLALLIMLCILCKEEKRLSELVGPLERYFSSGELSFTVENKQCIIEQVRQAYHSENASELSGLRIDFADWWFVLRAGSTEPKLRLVVEADTEDKLETRKQELISLILRKQGESAQ